MGVAVGGVGGTGVEKQGVFNQAHCVPGVSLEVFPPLVYTSTARTSWCFNGITRQEIGPEENRASNSDENLQAKSEQRALSSHIKPGGGGE